MFFFKWASHSVFVFSKSALPSPKTLTCFLMFWELSSILGVLFGYCIVSCNSGKFWGQSWDYSTKGKQIISCFQSFLPSEYWFSCRRFIFYLLLLAPSPPKNNFIFTLIKKVLLIILLISHTVDAFY